MVYTIVSYCKGCGSPIFVSGESQINSDRAFEAKNPLGPSVFRNCECFEPKGLRTRLRNLLR